MAKLEDSVSTSAVLNEAAGNRAQGEGNWLRAQVDDERAGSHTRRRALKKVALGGNMKKSEKRTFERAYRAKNKHYFCAFTRRGACKILSSFGVSPPKTKEF